MSSTYSTNLAIELIGSGDQAGTWGTTTNTNLGTLIEQAISGIVTQAITDGADTVITIPNGATGVARNMVIECTGALTAARNLIVPANKKLYFIYNNTTGGYAVTVKVSGQTGISVPNGAKVILMMNSAGTDIVSATNYQAALTLGSALPVLSGGTGVTTSTGSGSNVLSTSPTLVTPNLGTPTTLVGTNITGTAAGLTAGAASTATNATYATSAGSATNATYATSAGSATNASAATNAGAATNATFASSATNATYATSAGSAGSATNATSAGSATNATSAGYATYANSAGSAPANGGTSAACSGNAATASNPASGGSFITTSNIGSQSVNYATSAGSAPANGGTSTSLSGGSVAATTITATGNITAYYSDERLKTKVGNIENPLGKVRQIETMLYHANEIAVALGYDPSIIEVGVSAQSVQRVQPEATAPAPIDPQYLTVRYERLIPLLLESIKVLEDRIIQLEGV